MIYLFTKSTKLNWFTEEDVITWGLEEPVSHMGILLNGTHVFHSSASIFGGGSEGVKCDTLDDFLKARKVVFTYNHDIPAPDEIEMLDAVREIDWPYDYEYFWFLVRSAICLKLFRRKLPQSNKNDGPDAFICHEVHELLPDKYKPEVDLSNAITPYGVYLRLMGEL